MGQPKHKSLIEVETDGIPPYSNSKCREAEGTALSPSPTQFPWIWCNWGNIKGVGPFLPGHGLSEEKCVGGPKVIPCPEWDLKFTDCQTVLAVSLICWVRQHLTSLETLSVIMLATLLDPRFKVLRFHSQLKASETVKQLRMECANVATLQKATDASIYICECLLPYWYSFVGGSNLWHLLDSTVTQSRGLSNAIVEVQRYLAEQNIPWQHNKSIILVHSEALVSSSVQIGSFCVHLLLQSPVRGCILRLGKLRSAWAPTLSKTVLFLKKNW